MPNEDLGILFKAILAYVNNEDYEMPSHLKIAFGFIKNQLDLDKKKYELSCENGKRGGRPKTED